MSRFLVLVLVVAFGVRAAAVYRLSDRSSSPDALDEYLPMAANLLTGQGFINGAGEPDSVRGPGFPVLIAFSQMLWPGSDKTAVMWLHVVIDTLTVSLVWWQTRRILGLSAGMWSAILYAINPLAIYACALVSPEILFAFLLTASLVALQKGIESARWTWFACSGIAIGAAVLTRATPVLIVPVWGLWLITNRLHESRRNHREVTHQFPVPVGWLRCGLRQGVLESVLLCVAAAAVVLPWTYRNWRVFGEFIPVVANGGVNFYAGSSDRFWPPPPEHHQLRATRMQELIAAGAVPPPPENWSGPGAGDKYFFRLGLANYRLAWSESPWEVLRYLIRKELRLWYATQSGRMERFVGAVNVVWLLLAVVGCVVAARAGRLRPLVPAILTVGYFSTVLIAMFPLARYVVGFSPCLCVFGAATCVAVQQRVLLLFRSQETLRSKPVPIKTALSGHLPSPHFLGDWISNKSEQPSRDSR